MLIRKATKNDLVSIVALLAQDPLGKTREANKIPLPQSYTEAFKRIVEDQNQELIVLESKGKEILGTLQLSFIPYLTYRGGTRAQIEAVRIKKTQRGKGLGKKLFLWAINRARDKGAHLIQLTTDKKRPEALLFYESLGFKASHEGLKLHL